MNRKSKIREEFWGKIREVDRFLNHISIKIEKIGWRIEDFDFEKVEE